MRRTTLGPSSPPASRSWIAAFAVMVTAVWSTPCAAQQLSTSPSAAEVTRDTLPALVTLPRTAFQAHVVRWWEAAAVVGGVGALLADDRHVLHDVREHPTSGAADVADV